MRWSHAGLLALGLVCCTPPMTAQAMHCHRFYHLGHIHRHFHRHIRLWTYQYDIHYDDGLEFRSVHVPPSEQKGRPLTTKEFSAIRDPREGWFRASPADLTSALEVTIYPEKETIDSNGKAHQHALPPVTGNVTLFKVDSNHLIVHRALVMLQAPTRHFKYQIGQEPGKKPHDPATCSTACGSSASSSGRTACPDSSRVGRGQPPVVVRRVQVGDGAGVLDR
jgi:hypothetical protein